LKSAKVYKDIAFIDEERMGSIRKLNDLIDEIN